MTSRTLAGALAAAIVSATLTSIPAAADEPGRRVFEAKQCVRCHASGHREGGAPALEELRRRQGAWELAGRLWNHVPAMFTAFGTGGVPWPELTEVETSQLMTYLGATPEADPDPDPGRGLAALVQKGCLKCHTLRREGARIAPDLTDRADALRSPSEWATRIWRHTPRMAGLALERGILYPRFTGPEMAHLVAYLKAPRALHRESEPRRRRTP